VVTFSWQKALGGEAAHGVLILSPRAVARLESHTPAWPMPKLFRMTSRKDGVNKVTLDIFEGATINTPSMLAVEDAVDALKWAASIGGLSEMQRRANANLGVLESWAQKTGWVSFLAEDPAIRSNTSVCLKVIDPKITSLSEDAQADFAKKLAALLEKEAWPSTSAATATPLRVCGSGAARRSTRPTSTRSPPGSTGPSLASRPSWPRPRSQLRSSPRRRGPKRPVVDDASRLTRSPTQLGSPPSRG